MSKGIGTCPIMSDSTARVACLGSGCPLWLDAEEGYGKCGVMTQLDNLSAIRTALNDIAVSLCKIANPNVTYSVAQDDDGDDDES